MTIRRALSRLVTAAMDAYAPTAHRRLEVFTTTDTVGAEQLSAAEACVEVLPPWQHHTDPLADWEIELLHATTMTDEQWSAWRNHHHDQPAGAGAHPGVGGSRPPADAVAADDTSPLSRPGPPIAVGVDPSASAGATPDDDPTGIELVVTISRVLRDCGVDAPTTTAQIITRELRHAYEVRRR